MSGENVVDNIEEVIDVAKLEDWKVDKLVEEIKENNADIERYKEIMDKRIEEIKSQYESKREQLEKQNHYKLVTLREYAMTQKSLKSTKTQYKLPLLSGDLIIKKSIPKVAKPVKETYNKIKELYPEFVEEVTEDKVNWKELKKKFIIQNGVIYDQESGESLDGVFQIETNDEEIIVK